MNIKERGKIMVEENELIRCTNCDSEFRHITKVYDTTPMEMEYPPVSCGYKRGAVVIESTCENCGHKQYVVVGEHKGQVFLTNREEL